MRLYQKYAFWIGLLGLVAGLVAAPSPETARTRMADGFDFPVGKPDAVGYYKSRGFRAHYHMGEDWNGIQGGNSDLGKPVYCIGNGIVVLARDMRMTWGNMVIVRHTFLEDNQLKTVDSLYAHLDSITVHEGQQVMRGQQVGAIGTNHGMYPAHLHFEIRKNLSIGFNQSAFAKDLSNYYQPTPFILAHRTLPGAGRSALVAINTFNMGDNRFSPPTDESVDRITRPQQQNQPDQGTPSTSLKKPFRVNRFDDLNSPL